ncbi:MAG TPA: hypothetical protein VGX25_03435 [Actinophytocola sp.]|uniref:hypothetical protein n=1 Tax=Actinophytocola sp. TaxID=1872138 RepID=UPI002DDD5843|nr:hypothetical protein [Actinophytocola sp.]HEV2778432.1 hypothetical protein [Actinophytocola sp.]
MSTAVRSLLRAWSPTAFGASTLVVEIPLVYAAASRSANGARELAALGVCLAVLVVVNTPALAVTPLVVTEQDRHPLPRLWRYAVLIGCLGALILLAAAALPVAAIMVGGQPDLTGAVRAGLLGLVPNSVGVALRRYLHGRLIGAARTGMIVPAGIVRIAGSGALAWVGVGVFPASGAAVGGAALSAGALIETAVLAVAVRRLPAPDPAPRAEPRRALVRQHAHLSTARLLFMVPMLVTTVGIAHSAQAGPSLVVWPALYELAMLFCSPASDWESVSARARRANPGDRGPRRLTLLLITGFAGLFAVVVWSGLARHYLTGLLAVPSGPADLGLRAAPLLLPVPVLWVLRAHLRGSVMARHRTRSLVAAAGVHLIALTGFVGALSRTALPGVTVACLAMSAGLLAELGMLARGTITSGAATRASR